MVINGKSLHNARIDYFKYYLTILKGAFRRREVTFLTFPLKCQKISLIALKVSGGVRLCESSYRKYL